MRASSEQVSDVWVAGRHLVDGGRPSRLDLDDITARASAWQARMAPGFRAHMSTGNVDSREIERFRRARRALVGSERPAEAAARPEPAAARLRRSARAGSPASACSTSAAAAGCSRKAWRTEARRCSASISAKRRSRRHARTRTSRASRSSIGRSRRRALAAATPAERFDVVTCLELLEHVPDPSALIGACARLARPGGDVFFSTINRNPKAYLLAVVAAEYVLGWLPRGTHDYARFLKPSEIDTWARAHGLALADLTGMHHDPIGQRWSLGAGVDVNYLAHYRADPDSPTVSAIAPLQAVLFDLDGTLIDTAPDMAAALNRLRREHRPRAAPVRDPALLRLARQQRLC